VTDSSGYHPIEHHGIIGDLHTVALVGTDGTIDFMCFPHFDSPSVFASLLDRQRGGRFALQPLMDEAHRTQMYLPDSNVLLTRSLSDSGVGEILDFMPVEEVGHAHNLMRQIRTVRGEVRYRMVCAPRFDYGRAEHKLEGRDGHVLFSSQGSDGTVLCLRHSVPVQIANGDAVAEFTLRAGQTAEFCLEDASLEMGERRLEASDVEHWAEMTRNYWRRWIGRCEYHGRWQEMVRRSALVLKLLTSQQYGSIAAAPTFGLPEHIGGGRNWDYRYAWIRDSAFTVYALMRLGYTEEARAFIKWIEGLCRNLGTEVPLQIMYGLDGRKDLSERILEHLEGYCGSGPVRVGNGAYDQLQLDIYGELLDSVYLYNKYGEPIDYDFWRRLITLVDWVCENWQRPDEGIWEVRGGRREFTYSRLMCWVAIDRGLRIARDRSFPAPRERWLEVRDRVYRNIFESCWNEDVEAFVQSRGSSNLDASVLLMPMMKFIGATDPRWLSTLDTIERSLVDDSLVYRYRTPDGVAGGEGTFNMCTFWYVECLARAGRLDKARLVFEKMLGYANHLGLYSEELGPRAEHLGNFPQAFTHLALISAAWNLDKRLGEMGWRA